MVTPMVVGSDVALTGDAVNVVARQIWVIARMVARLDPEARRGLVTDLLGDLNVRGVINAEDHSGLLAALGGAESTPPKVIVNGDPAAVSDLLFMAVATAPATESFLDDLFTLAVTLVGTALGDLVGGPVGAGLAGYYAHAWAEAHPPSSW